MVPRGPKAVAQCLIAVSLLILVPNRRGRCSQVGRCFLPGTRLIDASGRLVAAEDVMRGSQIRCANGDLIRVMKSHTHEVDLRELVELVAGRICLTVTASHRVMVSLNGRRQEAQAAQLNCDYMVCLNTSDYVKLSDVRRFEERTGAVELLFDPDEAVEAYPPWPAAILSKGQAHHPRGSASAKPRTRRGGQGLRDLNARARTHAIEEYSMPDTQTSYMD